MRNSKKYKSLLVTLLSLMSIVVVAAQDIASPCPEVLIDQKYDHIPLRSYQAKGWDTAVTCTYRMIELTSEPYIPVQYFNGTYRVEEVAYNPPDPTFSAGTRMPVGTDDDFSSTTTPLSFPFFFFGIRKEGFRLGANGMITFATNQFAGGNACPWKYSAPIPWTSSTTGVPTMPEGASGSVPLARMRDAIYGIYEDTHPIGSYLNGQQGIYYGIQGEWPCRKIICSWNGIPTYPGNSNLNNRCTYQIVCYEGSNIIEIHVKRRSVNTNWQNGVGLIGIQNATGEPQQKSDSVGASNYFVVNGSPAAFWPEDKNTFNTPLDSVAYRFTPMGQTFPTYSWYRIIPGVDTVALTTYGDTNGMWVDRGYDPDHPTKTRAIVNPNVPSKYVLKVSFQNANGDWYNLSDTIFVGIDTNNTLNLEGICGEKQSEGKPQFDICRGQEADVSVRYSDVQTATSIEWLRERIEDGQHHDLEDTLFHMSTDDHVLHLHATEAIDTNRPDAIDSLWFRVVVSFSSGCSNYDTLLLRLLPNYETTNYRHICDGESYTWNHDGRTYYSSTTSPQVNLGTAGGCDSVVHLDLTVFDLSSHIDLVEDCKPITWLNGQTYATDNTATAATDTVIMQNTYGCDSVVQLEFHLKPVHAAIVSDMENLDYDHPTALLQDISTGSDGRTWLLPDGSTSVAPEVNIGMLDNSDSAVVLLVAESPFGCTDTARLVLPYDRETLWMPNAFTPSVEGRNATFGPIAMGIKSMDMYIYDRLGRLVYHCAGTECQWDGCYTDGSPCPQGGYAYVVRYTTHFAPEEMREAKGAVTLIR